MLAAAIALTLASATVHAGWNAVGHRSRAAGGDYAGAAIVAAALYAPLIACTAGRWSGWPGTTWTQLAASGAVEAAYYLCLARAYARGELATVYAIARSLPVLLVCAWSAATRGAAMPWTAALLVTAGCGALTCAGASRLRPRASGSAAAWAVGAAAATGGYTILMAAAIAGVAPADGRAAVIDILALAGWEASATAAAMSIGAVLARRAGAAAPVAIGGRSIGLALAISASWILALAAMRFARDAAQVVAFRQASIPIAALIAFVTGRQQPTPARIAGVAAVTLGLWLAALDHDGAATSGAATSHGARADARG